MVSIAVRPRVHTDGAIAQADHFALKWPVGKYGVLLDWLDLFVNAITTLLC